MPYKDPEVARLKNRAWLERNKDKVRAYHKSYKKKGAFNYTGIDFDAISRRSGMHIKGIKTCVRRWNAPTLSPDCFWLWHRAITAARDARKRGWKKRLLASDPERVRAQKRADYLKHKEKRLATIYRYYPHMLKRMKYRFSTDVHFRLRLLLGTRIRAALRHQRQNKTNRTHEHVGCTIPELKARLESTFTEGMSWERFFAGEIHIDHIRPCASFDLADPEQQKACFHFSNLQALWWRDNLQKRARLDWKPNTPPATHPLARQDASQRATA